MNFINHARFRGVALAWLAVSVLGQPSRADPVESYTIDNAHSSVQFKIRHLFSKVPGRFREFKGTIHFDSQDVAKSKVEAVISTATIDTANDKRDQHLRGADFFDVEKYPTIVFRSTACQAIDKDTGDVRGDLTMHGVTKPVTLRVNFFGAGPDPQGKKRAGFDAATTIDRTAFGISYNKIIEGGGTILGNEIEIQIDIEAALEPSPAKTP